MVASSEDITIDDESLHVIAHKADGAMRDALTIFDQTVAFCGTDVKYQDVLRNLNVLDYEYSFSLVDAFLRGDYPAAMLTFDEILTKGFNALHFVAALSSHFRDLLVCKSGGLEALLELPDSLKKRYKEQADRCSLQFLYEALGVTTQCESGYRASINPRLHIEFALMRLSFLLAKPAGSPVSAPAQAPAPAPDGKAPVAQQGTGEMLRSPEPSRQAAPQEVSRPVVSAAVPESPVSEQIQRASAPVTPEDRGDAGESASQGRRTRAARGASLSMKSVMESPKETVSNDQIKESPAPSDDVLKAKWPELAAQYGDKPRLASMLSTTTLTISGNDESKMVVFNVVNDAQKDWVESKLLHELEGRFRSIVGSMKVYLRVAVMPDDTPQQKKIYMPSEQAKELMASNEEVKSLVQDLGLDIK
jgi:DNA polymerase-3 subunit gamma/tau